MHFVSCAPWAPTIRKRCHDPQLTSSRISLRVCDRCNPFYWAIFLIAEQLCRHDTSYPTTTDVNSEPLTRRNRRNQFLLPLQDLFVIQKSGPIHLCSLYCCDPCFGPLPSGLKLLYEWCVLITGFLFSLYLADSCVSDADITLRISTRDCRMTELLGFKFSRSSLIVIPRLTSK
jgi:hypothetical protein